MKPWTLAQVRLNVWYRRTLQAYQAMGQTVVPEDATWIQIEGVLPGLNSIVLGGRYWTMDELMDNWVWTAEPHKPSPPENPCGKK